MVGLIEATGRRGLAVVTDVTQAADRERLIDAAVAAFGPSLLSPDGTAPPGRPGRRVPGRPGSGFITGCTVMVDGGGSFFS